jgi:3-hydroxybutyryl-CoA dehydrogenase
MGQGIALTMALAGARVMVMDNDAQLTTRLAQKIRDDAAATGATIDLSEVDLVTMGGADLVIEAVVERMEVKLDLLARLGAVASGGLVVASNTSSLSIGEMSRAFADPSRVVGMHFFNPPTKMRLVEVVRSDATSDDTLRFAIGVVEALDKTPVVCVDSPNFIVNRVCRPLYYEAELLVTQGVECARVDAIARSALGHRMGPLELLDFTGLHTHLSSSETALREFGESRYRPVPLVRRLVRSGMTGKASGRGFYDYARESPRDARARVTETPAAPAAPFVVLGPGAPGWGLTQSLRVDHQIIVYSCPVWATERDVTRVLELAKSGPVIVDSSDGVWRDVLPADVGWFRVHHVDGGPFAEVVADDEAGIEPTSAVAVVLASIGASFVSVLALPGLVADRLRLCLINEATLVHEEGTASPEAIDTALTLGMNHPQGPFEMLADLGARDVAGGLRSMVTQTGDARYRASQSLLRAAAGRRRRDVGAR